MIVVVVVTAMAAVTKQFRPCQIDWIVFVRGHGTQPERSWRGCGCTATTTVAAAVVVADMLLLLLGRIMTAVAVAVATSTHPEQPHIKVNTQIHSTLQ